MGCDILKLPTTPSLDVSSMVNVDVNLPRDVTLQDFKDKSANPGFKSDVKDVSELVEIKSIAGGQLGEAMGPTALVEQTGTGLQNIGNELEKTIKDCFKSATSLKDQLEKLLSKQINLDFDLEKELKKMFELFPNSPEAIIDMIRKSVSISIDIPGVGGFGAVNKCVDAYLNEAAGLISDFRKLACGSVDKLTPKAKLDMVKDPELSGKNLGVIQDGIQIQIGDSIKTGKNISTTPPVMDLPGLATPPIVPPGTVTSTTGDVSEPVKPPPEKKPPAAKAKQSAQDELQSEELQVKQAIPTGCYDFLSTWSMASNNHVSNMVGMFFDNFWPDVFEKRGSFDKKENDAYNLLTRVCGQYVDMLVAKWFFSDYWNSSACGTKAPGITTETAIQGSSFMPLGESSPDKTIKQIVKQWKWSQFDESTVGVYVPSVGTMQIPTSRFAWIVDELFTPKYWIKPHIRNMTTVKTDLERAWEGYVFTNLSTVDVDDLQKSRDNFRLAVDSALVRRLIKYKKQDEMEKLQSTGFAQMSEEVQKILNDETKILGKYTSVSLVGEKIPDDTIYYVGTFDWTNKQVTEVSLLPGSPGKYLNW